MGADGYNSTPQFEKPASQVEREKEREEKRRERESALEALFPP